MSAGTKTFDRGADSAGRTKAEAEDSTRVNGGCGGGGPDSGVAVSPLAMTSGMIETARALAEVWDGPALAQWVVSEGGPVYRCPHCMKEVTEAETERESCPRQCGAGGILDPDPWEPEGEWPNLVTVPDLTSAANGGVLLVALKVAWAIVTPKAHDEGMWALERWNDCHAVEAATLAHASALAHLAEASR